MASDVDGFDFILDAWALLAYFAGEAGAERVGEILKSAENSECRVGISIINVGEIAYIVERERSLASAQEVLAILRSLPLTVLPADENVVLSAAHIKAARRLSYADAIAAATARLRQAKLATGDAELKALDGSEIAVEWLG
jgi:predicted nucleic acid-binding protein